MPEEKEIKISDELVERITKKFLKKMNGHLRGTKVAVMNATIREGYAEFLGFSSEELTKINILQRIGREISRAMGINPNGKKSEREKYNKIKGNLRAKISNLMRDNAEIKAKLERIVKRKRFYWSAKIGKNEKWGKRFANMSKWIKKRRNL